MKSIKSIFFTVTLVLALSACANSSPTTKSNLPNQTSSVIENTITPTSIPNPTLNPTPTPEPTPDITFEPNKDLQVVVAFVYDNDTYVVVENAGEQAVLNYRIAYINFDKNGFVATRDSDGYETGKASTANIMPGGKDIAMWYGADGSYAVATVIGIDYADGTTWDVTGAQIDSWVKETSTSFSIDNQKAIINELKEIGTLAESNEWATLVDYKIKHGNQFSAKHDFHFTVKNTSEQGIAKLNVFVLEFDENGFPVSVSPYDKYCINGHQTGGTANLAPGESSSYSNDLFISPTTTQIKVVISFIEFQDGSEWENPYINEWIVGNTGSY